MALKLSREMDSRIDLIAEDLGIPIDLELLRVVETIEEVSSIHGWASGHSERARNEELYAAAKSKLRKIILEKVRLASTYADAHFIIEWAFGHASIRKEALEKVVSLAKTLDDATHLWGKVRDYCQYRSIEEEAARAHLHKVAIEATRNAPSLKEALRIHSDYRYAPLFCDCSEGLIGWCSKIETLKDVQTLLGAYLEGQAAEILSQKRRELSEQALAQAQTFNDVEKLDGQIDGKLLFQRLAELVSSLEEASRLDYKSLWRDKEEQKLAKEIRHRFLEKELELLAKELEQADTFERLLDVLSAARRLGELGSAVGKSAYTKTLANATTVGTLKKLYRVSNRAEVLQRIAELSAAA
ncbi:hypothetical protein IID27_00205 [Patescibacteria group bacterium]|nr:hypothetical protein [Patescibacteria group bacterium]